MTKNSQKSLVARLREIEGISSTIEVDKIKEYKKVFEEFRKSNPLVRVVIESRTTFSSEAEKAIKIFGGNPYLPYYVSGELLGNFQELVEVIEYPSPNLVRNSINLLGNPVVGGLGIGGLFYMLQRTSSHQSRDISINRRDFLGTVGIPLVGAAIGSVWGSFESLVRDTLTDSARENATYVDSIVQQLYRK